MPVHMQEQRAEATERHIRAMTREKPELESLIAAFGQVQAAIDHCRATLPQPDVAAVSLDTRLLRAGVPLLEQPDAISIVFHLETAALMLLPILADIFPPLASKLEMLEKNLQESATLRLFDNLLAFGDEALLQKAAQRCGMDGIVLAYVLECLARPALENAATALAPLFADVPWNFWNKGRCPICGSKPSMSLLRPGQQEPTEFLKNSSAQRWLCCSACAHTWRFSRTLCPECGADKQNDREYFHVADKNLERVELCPNCNHYLLTMDIRERLSPLDHRLAPLGLVHLDILARQQGYAPIVLRPWNLLESGIAVESRLC